MTRTTALFFALVIGYLAIGATAATPPRNVPARPAVLGQLITHMSRSRRIVALTFDACETHKPAGYDAKLIAILRATHTPATLMLCGSWMLTHPAATRDLGRDSLFEIGSHSYWHPHMTRLTRQQIIRELQDTQDEQIRLTARQGTLFRPPYGEYNPLLLQTAADMGLRTITWEVVSGDPDPHVTAKAMVREILRRTRPGSIIIMHMNGRGWHTDEALPSVIGGLRKKGYTFVKVSDGLE